MKTALIPGSFDPVTFGHIDLFSRAARLFDRAVVAVCTSHSKTHVFAADERAALIRAAWADMPGNVSVVVCEASAAELAKSMGAVLVKGVRGPKDFEYEQELALVNRNVFGAETVFLPSAQELSHVSAGAALHLFKLGADAGGMLPGVVVEALRKKLP